jgi:hypothetical protein
MRPASFGGRAMTSSSWRSAVLRLRCGAYPRFTEVDRIDVVLVFFRLVAREALFGGVGYLRLLAISALPELNHP